MTHNENGEEIEHATSVGQTGGLPGDNAHWRTRELSEDELASSVQRGDVAAGGTGDPQDRASGEVDIAPDTDAAPDLMPAEIDLASEDDAEVVDGPDGPAAAREDVPGRNPL